MLVQVLRATKKQNLASGVLGTSIFISFSGCIQSNELSLYRDFYCLILDYLRNYSFSFSLQNN